MLSNSFYSLSSLFKSRGFETCASVIIGFSFQSNDYQTFSNYNGSSSAFSNNEPFIQIKTEIDDETMLNDATKENQYNSSPVYGNRRPPQPDTPSKMKKSSSMLIGPRTPTPFKNALDEMRKRRERM